ncbi:MAG: Na/Pi cotransporter family protein [Oscillospiraceae bacterium]|nr:Na/Pi cotransporter family protein [Oscillospiraceae bacterium]
MEKFRSLTKRQFHGKLKRLLAFATVLMLVIAMTTTFYADSAGNSDPGDSQVAVLGSSNENLDGENNDVLSDESDELKTESEDKKEAPTVAEQMKTVSKVGIAIPVITVLAGLALFLFGMKYMSDGLEAAAGSKMKSILEKMSKNRFVGLLTGMGITFLIQSSSATTVMLVGFVNAGLMRLTQVIGVIMGANIGTTITGVIVSLKITEYTPIAIIVGCFIILGAKRNSTKYKGQVFAGFGILFLGMTLMSGALKPIAEIPAVENALATASNPFVGLMVGMIVTEIMQSSSAVTGILIALGATGAIDLSTAIFIVYGTNIGTCITALLASISANRAAKRVAVMHIAFNVVGSVLFTIITLASYALPTNYIQFVENLRPENVGQQIALVHVIFNVVTAIVVFPFANLLVVLAEKIVREKKGEEETRKQLLYLDERLLKTPHIVVEQVHKEVERMAQLSLKNYKLSVDMFLNRNEKNVDKIKKTEELINFLNHEITRYLIKISALKLDEHDQRIIGSLHHVINDIERIGDHAENIMEFSAPFIEDNKMFSTVALGELNDVVSNVEKVLTDAISLFENRSYDQSKITQIKKDEDVVDDKVEKSKNNHIERLNQGVCTATSGMLFVNMLSDLERISDHAVNIANSLKFEEKAVVKA